MKNTLLSKSWILLGITSLLVSGALSLIVTAAKLPLFKSYVSNIDLIRWVLVIHVNLANLVWFTAIPVGLLHLSVSSNIKNFSAFKNFFYRFSFYLGICGIVLFSAVIPQEGVRPVLSNYIPVLTHIQHDIGLIFYFCSIAINYFLYFYFTSKNNNSENKIINELQTGIRVGGLFFCAACFTFVLSYIQLSKEQFPSINTYYELGMWGGGHLLQHSNSVFLVVSWAYLLKSSQINSTVLQKSNLKGIFYLLSAPLLIVPIIAFYPPTSSEFRDTFTQLMRWGMAPPMLLFIFGAGFSLKNKILSINTQTLAFILSAWLAILGFIFGFSIQGSDLRIPGHYHATIGAVTLAFMVISFRLIFNDDNDRKIKLTIWFYGIGQSLFATGMFTAGCYGISRKTYGSEHLIENFGQQLGFSILAIGGLIALLGGAIYAFAVIESLRKLKRTR